MENQDFGVKHLYEPLAKRAVRIFLPRSLPCGFFVSLKPPGATVPAPHRFGYGGTGLWCRLIRAPS